MGAGFAVNSWRRILLSSLEAGLHANDALIGSFKVILIEKTRRINKSAVAAQDMKHLLSSSCSLGWPG